jgi:hypothetical protein
MLMLLEVMVGALIQLGAGKEQEIADSSGVANIPSAQNSQKNAKNSLKLFIFSKLIFGMK